MEHLNNVVVEAAAKVDHNSWVYQFSSLLVALAVACAFVAGVKFLVKVANRRNKG